MKRIKIRENEPTETPPKYYPKNKKISWGCPSCNVKLTLTKDEWVCKKCGRAFPK